VLQTTLRKEDLYSKYLAFALVELAGNLNSLCHTGDNLRAYQLTFDGQGRPNFEFVASSPSTMGCRGTPVVTSLNGLDGSAVVSNLIVIVAEQPLLIQLDTRSGWPILIKGCPLFAQFLPTAC